MRYNFCSSASYLIVLNTNNSRKLKLFQSHWASPQTLSTRKGTCAASLSSLGGARGACTTPVHHSRLYPFFPIDSTFSLSFVRDLALLFHLSTFHLFFSLHLLAYFCAFCAHGARFLSFFLPFYTSPYFFTSSGATFSRKQRAIPKPHFLALV